MKKYVLWILAPIVVMGIIVLVSCLAIKHKNNKIQDSHSSDLDVLGIISKIDQDISSKIKSDIDYSYTSQLKYRSYKEVLKSHENSVELLIRLSRVGFQTYPDEVIDHCQKIISIDSDNADGYIMMSKAYQILGDFDIALAKLKHIQFILIDRVMRELKKRKPYRYKGAYLHPDIEINYAKAYMRTFGLDPGKDVSYDYDKQGFNILSILFGTRRPTIFKGSYMMASDMNEMTSIKDLADLDMATHLINYMERGMPIWTPSNRLPIVDDKYFIFENDK